MEGCTKNRILLVKILKNRIRYKIKRFASFWLKFWHNTHFDSKKMFKKLNFKNFHFWTPHGENLQIFPDSPDFLPKISQSGLTNIFSHLKLLGFQDILMWHILAKFHGFRWLHSVVVAFLGWYIDRKPVKTLKNRVCSKIKNLASFSLIFSQNTYISKTNMSKK